MTICISGKITREDGTVVTRAASDSEVSFGNKRLRGISNSCEKIIQFPGANISASGSGCVFEALDILKSDPKYYNSVQFRNRADIRMFAIDLFEQVDSLIEQAKISREEVSMGVILVTTEDSIYGIFQDLSIFSFDHWFSSGSGSDTAVGLMTAYYKELGAHSTEEDLENILIKAIEATCEVEQGCNPPIKLYTTLAPNPPIKTKTKKRKLLTDTNDSAKISEVEGVSKKNDNKKRS